MNDAAYSAMSRETDSETATEDLCAQLKAQLGQATPKALVVYATIEHDFTLVMETLSATFPGLPIIGCSTGGIVANDDVAEATWALAAMAFAGDSLEGAVAIAERIDHDPTRAGEQLAEATRKKLQGPPKLAVLLYDPLCGADASLLSKALQSRLGCAVVGGGAGQPWGPPVRTYQFCDGEVRTRSAVALVLTGSFEVTVALSHGTEPMGGTSVVTRSEGNRVYEIDGESVVSIFKRISGYSEGQMLHQSMMAAWALGIRRTVSTGTDSPTEQTLVRGVFGFDFEAGAAIFQTAVPTGAKVSWQHRTRPRVIDAIEHMQAEVLDRLADATPWAAMSFECAARTAPFLGPEATRAEHQRLRGAFAQSTPWLGMMAWGEIAPVGGVAEFHNYTYPVALLTPARSTS